MSRHVEPAEALDRFFAVIRQEAIDNPQFAARLLDVLGAQVIFRGEAAVSSVDPVQIAMRGQEEFRKTFLSFTVKDLKNLVKEFNLATPSDMRGKTKAPQIVDLMWEGAVAKLRDRGLTKA